MWLVSGGSASQGVSPDSTGWHSLRDILWDSSAPVAEEAILRLPPACRISPTGTLARLVLHLMENVRVEPAAPGATVRAGESYAWMQGSEASLKISEVPSGVFLCDGEVFTAIYLLPTESFSNLVDCTPAFHPVCGQTAASPSDTSISMLVTTTYANDKSVKLSPVLLSSSAFQHRN